MLQYKGLLNKAETLTFFPVTIRKWNYFSENFLAYKVFGNGPSAVLRIRNVAEVCDRWRQEHDNILLGENII